MSKASKRAVSVCDYKNKINDLETEVGTLKQRLDELRRAKNNKIITKPEPTVRRNSTRKLSTEGDEESAKAIALLESAKAIALLSNKAIRLQHELELLQIKYNQNTTVLNETISQLSQDIENLKQSQLTEICQLNKSHNTALEKVKKSHLEELALLTERCEEGELARKTAEEDLMAYKHKMRLISVQDIEMLKSELTRMREEYYKIKEVHEEEVIKLEKRIFELVNEKFMCEDKRQKREVNEEETSQRKLQLIPNRPMTAVHRKCSPTRSSSPNNKEQSSKSNVKPHKFTRPKSCIERTSTDLGQRERKNLAPDTRPITCWNSSEKKMERGRGNVEERSDHSINSTTSITHYPLLHPRTSLSTKIGPDKLNKSFPSCDAQSGGLNGRYYSSRSNVWQPQKRRARNYVQGMNI